MSRNFVRLWESLVGTLSSPLGKTKIVQTIVDNAGDETPLLDVNMRLPSKAQSTDALECLQEEAKRRWTAKNLPPGAKQLVVGLSAVAGALGKAD